MNRTARAAIGAVCGALAAVAVAGTLPLLLAALLAAGAVFAGARTLGGRAPALQPVAIGAALILLRATAGAIVAPPTLLPPDTTAPSARSHSAVVVSVGAPAGGLQRAIVQLGPPEPAEFVYAWLPRYPQIAQAAVIIFDGPLEQAPQTGDFADYLARSSIFVTARAATLKVVGGDGSPVAALESLRRGAADLVTRVLPEPQAGLATAMAIGLRDVVSSDVTADFRTSGLSHVVAISGWQIATLGAVVAALFGGLPRRPRSVLVLVVIFGYTLLAGAAPSILRAALMAAAVIVARESGRRGQAVSALSLTCICLLLLDPQTVTDAGFQLSAVATAGLLAWATPLHGWLVTRVPTRTPGWLLEAMAVSLAAQASTLPLVLVQFGQLSLVAPLANLLIAPLVAPAMLVTAICFVCGAAAGLGVPLLMVAPVTLIGSLLVGAMIAIAHLCASLPFASIQLPEPLNYVGGALCALAILAFLRRRRHGESAKATKPKPTGRRFSRSLVTVLGAAVAMSLLLAVVVSARPDGRLHVTVLDIGQGDSILLQGASGGRMLIDTGPDPDLLMTRLDARIPSWDRRIDVVLLTHPHEDHVGGLALLLQRYRVGSVLETGMVGRGPGDAAYRREMVREQRSSTIVAAGDQLMLDGARLDVDWPPPGSVPPLAPEDGKKVNNTSIVLELHYGSRTMLFTGDAEEEIDPQLIAQGIGAHVGGHVDVLKVAHHGSGTATTDAFLDAVQPKIAIISVGAYNDYGHPAPATLQRLENHGTIVYRTDLNGSVEVATDGRDLTVRPERQPDQPAPGPTLAVPVADDPRRPVAIGRPRRRRTYNRPDVRSVESRRRRARALAAAQPKAAAALDDRGRDRVLPRRGHDPPWRRARRHGGRDSRAAPRR